MKKADIARPSAALGKLLRRILREQPERLLATRSLAFEYFLNGVPLVQHSFCFLDA